MKRTDRLFILATIAYLVGLIITADLHAATGSKKKEIKKLLAKRNILATPSLSTQVTTYTVNFSRISSKAAAPALSTIPGTSIKNLFWRDINGVNVIDALNSGNATKEICDEFYAGRGDGQSGGLGSCHLAESVGFAYSTVVQSGLSSCFIKTFPTKEIQQSGAVTLVSGSFPENNIEKIFSVPANIPRVVKINMIGERPEPESPEQIFVEIPAAVQNNSSGSLYRANLWFCKPDTGLVQGYNKIQITKALQFKVELGDAFGKGKNYVTAGGFLTKRGNNLIWDSEKARTATAMSARGEFDKSKNSIEITKNQQIKLQRSDNFNGRAGKGYLFTQYSGNTVDSLRFMKGAFNELHRDDSIISASEYNGTFYETDTDSSFLSTVSTEDLSSEFYSSSLEFDIDTSPYSCSVTADIEINLDLSNDAVKDIMSECAPVRQSDMRFCHEDPEIIQAEENFKSKCSYVPPKAPTPKQAPPQNKPPKP